MAIYRMKTIIFLVTVCVLLGGFFKTIDANAAELNKSLNKSENPCSLNYAWDEWPPFMQKTSSQPTGFQLELIGWITKELDCQLVFSRYPWSDALALIKTGEIDISGRANKDTSRLEFARFSQAYRDDILVLYVRRGEAKLLAGKNLQELLLSGMKLAVEENVYYGATVADLKQDKETRHSIKQYPSEVDIITALNAREIDAFFSSPFSIDNKKMRQPSYDLIEEYPLEILVAKMHFMFSKKTVSQAFVDRFNVAYEKVKQSNQYKNHWYWKTIK